jgi:ATP-binding cassette subfamily F protein 3
MLSDSKFLILDEPTNHLDIQSKEILEDAINSYEGTVLYVSHDRYFINRTAGRILDLTEGHFVNYIGNYDYYLEKYEDVMAADRKMRAPEEAAAAPVAQKTETASSMDWKAQKEEQARLRKKENDLKKCEEEIARLEERQSLLNEKLLDPAIASNSVKLQEVSGELAEIEEKLLELMEKWEELSQ